jgi:hypothetical protein
MRASRRALGGLATLLANAQTRVPRGLSPKRLLLSPVAGRAGQLWSRPVRAGEAGGGVRP